VRKEIIITVLIFTCVNLQIANCQIWYGRYVDSHPSIGRLSQNGVFLSEILPVSGQYVEDIELVSNEVWVSYWQGNSIDRFDVNGTFISTIDVDDMNAGLAYVFATCGDVNHPYPVGDLNNDCRVNLLDIAIISIHWLECTHPDCE